jgi:alkaline phosphatase D
VFFCVLLWPVTWDELCSRDVTRRDLLRVGRDVAASIALGALPGVGWQSAATPDSPFAWGVASGDPLPDGVVLWTRLDPAVARGTAAASATWEISENDSFTRIVQRGTSLAPARLGHSVHVEVQNLRPGRDYWYRFAAGGHQSPAGRTRTAPAPDARADGLRFAFVSCQNYEHGYYTAFQHLAREDVDLVVHLGDYIYERHFASQQSVRRHEAEEVFTLAEYRRRYALYRSDADLQAAHAACPWIVTTDDHEVANNYAGPFAERPTTRAQFLLRRAAAYQAYYEFMPLRRSSLPSGSSIPLYRRLRFGHLAEFHVLDSRQFRSDQACDDGRKARCPQSLVASRTMLGGPQERWLEQGLHSSRSTWNVLANQVMLAQTKAMVNGSEQFSMDRWDGYVAAQRRMLDLLEDVRHANPVVITGDIHSNWVADLKADFDNESSRTVAAEFVGTSISSGGDGSDNPSPILKYNPHIRFFNARRGYVRVAVKPSRMTADYRVVPYVSKPGAPIDTRASFVVEAGNPGVRPA